MNILLSPEDEDLRSKISTVTGGYCVIRHGTVGSSVFRRYEKLHRVVMWRVVQILLPPREIAVIDHINNIKLDCRRENLRLIKQSLNILKDSKKCGASKYIGVTKVRGLFRVNVNLDGKSQSFGSYASEEEAAFMVDVWRYRTLHEEAPLNFPERLVEIEQEALKIVNPHIPWKRRRTIIAP